MVTSTTGLSSPGIGSGLDVNAIVDKLMALEKQPITALAAKVSTDQSKISAYGSLKSALASLQSAAASLSSASSFRTLAGTVGDASILTASLGTGAVAGSYSVEITQLAQVQKLVSEGFAATDTTVGGGSLTFDFGTVTGGNFVSSDSGTKSVTIDAGQQTLAGIRDAVNAAGVGVTATIVNDGNANGNRLVFTSNTTGAANSLKISVVDEDLTNTDATGLSQLAYDPAAAIGLGRNLTEKLAAQDALLTIDGIEMHKSSNTVTDAIQGLTLNLLKENPDEPTTITISANSSSVTSTVSSFVKAYNDLDTMFDNLTKYDPTKKQASILTGDATVRTVQSQLRSLLGGAMGNGAYSTLGQIGISFKSDGSITLDNGKLNAAVAANPDAVTKLFAAAGAATDAQVSVSSFNGKTTPGAYAVQVDSLATRGTLVGGSPAALTIVSGVNDQIVANIDGVDLTVTLSAGVYASAAALGTELQGKLNGSSVLSDQGSTVAVSESAGTLTVRSNRFGSTSNVTLSGTAVATLFGASPTATVGTDVVGSIGGYAATGDGQILRGVAGSPIEGMQLTVSGGAAGARGTVTYGTGFAYRVNDLLTSILGTDGQVAARTNGLTREISDFNKRTDVLNARLAVVRANYLAQFQSLDVLLSNLNTQSTALAQAIESLPGAANT